MKEIPEANVPESLELGQWLSQLAKTPASQDEDTTAKRQWHQGTMQAKCVEFFDAFRDQVSLQEILNSADEQLLRAPDRDCALFFATAHELHNFYWQYFSKEERAQLEHRTVTPVAGGGVTAMNIVLSLLKALRQESPDLEAFYFKDLVTDYAKKIARLDLDTYSRIKEAVTADSGFLWEPSNFSIGPEGKLFWADIALANSVRESAPEHPQRVGCPIIFQRFYVASAVEFLIELSDAYQPEKATTLDDETDSWDAAGFQIIEV